MVAGKDAAKIVFGDWPEKFMFVLANLLLGASLWSGYQYTEQLTLACTSAIEKKTGVGGPAGEKTTYLIADVFSPRINYLYDMQTGYLVFGSLISGLTLVSAHRFKEKQP